MMSEKELGSREHRHRMADWLSVHAWWTALLVGGLLCIVALVLS